MSVNNMNNKNIQHDISADYIRALAIVCVVILHTIGISLNKSSPAIGINWWIAILIESVTKVAVPLFIMLSGYLILDKNKKYNSSSEFYKKRIKKIGIPIIFWSIFYYLGFTIFTGKSLSIMGFLYSFIFLNIYFHLYFLFIIAGLYIITPMLKAYLNSISNIEKRRLVILLFIYSIISTILVYSMPSKISFWSIFTVFIPFVVYYLAGDYLRTFNVTDKRCTLMTILYLIILTITVIIKYYAWNISMLLHNIWIINYFSDALNVNVVLLSLISFIFLLKSKKIIKISSYKFISKPMQKVSSYSFGIYIIHPIILYLLNKFFIINLNNPIAVLFILLDCILIITISYFIVNFCSKIKHIKLLFG